MPVHHKQIRAFLFCCWFVFASLPLSAQDGSGLMLTADALQDGQAVELEGRGWRYHVGDDGRWADAKFDDSAWEILSSTRLTPGSLPRSGWNGIGWFRLRLRIDPALAGESLSLLVRQGGASEIYLDGKLFRRFGTVGSRDDIEREFDPNGIPAEIEFGEGEHVIAIRHSCISLRDMQHGWGRWLANRTSADEGEQEWGEARLQDCLHTSADESAEAIVNRVFSEIDQFAGAAPQHDDITLLVFKSTSAVNSELTDAETSANSVAGASLP